MMNERRSAERSGRRGALVQLMRRGWSMLCLRMSMNLKNRRDFPRPKANCDAEKNKSECVSRPNDVVMSVF